MGDLLLPNKWKHGFKDKVVPRKLADYKGVQHASQQGMRAMRVNVRGMRAIPASHVSHCQSRHDLKAFNPFLLEGPGGKKGVSDDLRLKSKLLLFS